MHAYLCLCACPYVRPSQCLSASLCLPLADCRCLCISASLFRQGIHWQLTDLLIDAAYPECCAYVVSRAAAVTTCMSIPCHLTWNTVAPVPRGANTAMCAGRALHRTSAIQQVMICKAASTRLPYCLDARLHVLASPSFLAVFL